MGGLCGVKAGEANVTSTVTAVSATATSGQECANAMSNDVKTEPATPGIAVAILPLSTNRKLFRVQKLRREEGSRSPNWQPWRMRQNL